MNGNDERREFPLKVTTSLSDAAKDIVSHSFAIYQVSKEAAKKIQIAHQSATIFFHFMMNKFASKNERQEYAIKHELRQIISGNLHGYNEPSATKLLFRAYNDDEKQPWPEQTDLVEKDNDENSSVVFQDALLNIMEDLHHILIECTKHILEIVHDESTGPSTAKSSRKKRRRQANSDVSLAASSRSCTNTMSSVLGQIDRSKCPLDYFFYHNKHPKLINCSEHIDRGVLILVCLTNIPGLEVGPRPKQNGEVSNTNDFIKFVCPETLVENEVNSSSNLVCIMVGAQLSKLLAETTTLLPCIHRVKNPLKGERLSISYELRL